MIIIKVIIIIIFKNEIRIVPSITDSFHNTFLARLKDILCQGPVKLFVEALEAVDQ